MNSVWMVEKFVKERGNSVKTTSKEMRFLPINPRSWFNNSHEMPSLIFFEKHITEMKISSAVIVISTEKILKKELEVEYWINKIYTLLV